ncbi:MAG: NADH:flavin oxidoreductase [Desulfobacterales bacterium]|nr:NADH:flavin oxidoreductase [Desulfobacterales bacterium]
MSKLFESTTINGMALLNRFVRSATWEGVATADGKVTPALIKMMTDLADGGVGLIMSGHTYVRPEGQATPWQLAIHKDDYIDGLREMTDAVHNCGGKIVMQLAHAGAEAPEKLTGQSPLVVSDFEGLSDKPRREITKGDISELVKAFADASKRAQTAGFDGVQLHAAHGYLLSQFLSPNYNKREDEYGGTIENRSRIYLETYRAIRKAVGIEYPVMIKINGQDYEENGLSLEDSLFVGKMLADEGLDAIELSGGVGDITCKKGINKIEKEAYFKDDMATFKKEINIPLILVGGVRSFEVADKLVTNGITDYISMCRPFICEPDLINRWKNGDLRKSECKSDNLCFRPAMKGEGIYCVTREKKKK